MRSTTATVGLALDEKTDLQASYFYYRAHNFVDNSGASFPYGTGAQEHAVTAQISRQMNPHVRWTLKYGFYENNDKLYAGLTDYRAHVILSTLQYRF